MPAPAYAGGLRHLLVGDHAGNRRQHFDDRRRMILVGAQHAQVLFGGFDRDLGLVRGVSTATS